MSNKVGSSVDFGGLRSCIFQESDASILLSSGDFGYLINLQLQSYKNFLYGSVKKDLYTKDDESVDSGIMNAIRNIFPVVDNSGNFAFDIISYTIGGPLFSNLECIKKDITYTAKMRVKVRIVIWDSNTKDDKREILSVKEQEIYFCDIPLMTENADFIINGSEYVVVSQIHRSPGLLLDCAEGGSSKYERSLYLVRIIPYRGSWLDMEFDNKDLIYCRIDKKRKFYVTSLLRALKYSAADIINLFYSSMNFEYIDGIWMCTNDLQDFLGCKLIVDCLDVNDKVIISAGTIITDEEVRKICVNGVQEKFRVNFTKSFKLNYSCDIYDENGEILFTCKDDFVGENLELMLAKGIKNFSVLMVDNFKFFPYIINTLNQDKNDSYESALQTFYKIIRPGEMVSIPVAEYVLKSLFFDSDRYDLSPIGRIKINQKLGYGEDIKDKILRNEDIVDSIKILIDLRNGVVGVDDVDDLGNRRVRAVGELLENQFRSGVIKCFRGALDKLSSVIDVNTVTPFDLLNSKVINAMLKDFFNSLQLSQFMDQTNPLAEITHKRRISSLGPGGLNQERAGFEIRDVHFTHYGRLCAAETPDNNRVGLVNSAALCSRVDQYGLIEVPYYKVVNSVVTDAIVFLSAFDEQGKNLAQSNIKLDKDKKIVDELVYCRRDLSFTMVIASEVDYVDVAPYQIVSIGTSLIPFLENNDATRALMGANMQRQALPLNSTESPWVGTGMETMVVRDAGAVVLSEIDGEVMFVDNSCIIITSTDSNNLDFRAHKLQKYRKSNFSTCINFRPCVNKGQIVKKGDLLADGFASDRGELALGRNLVAAFLSWEGLNFEDSMIISKRAADMYASIHIEELECMISDTKLGPEKITRDIPGIDEIFLSHLNESGVVHIGTKVKPGDILVGAVAPVVSSPLTPEEKLLRMVFGEKVCDVKDCSLYVPAGINGTVIDIQIYFLKGVTKDDYLLADEKRKIDNLIRDCNNKKNALYKRIKLCFASFFSISKACNDESCEHERLCAGTKVLYKPEIERLFKIEFESNEINRHVLKLHERYRHYINEFDSELKKRAANIVVGDELSNGVLQIMKVFVAVKHYLQPGDKIAGRHGNKGVISKVLPIFDMPHMADGTPIDIILNPLGVPSRMNIGQIRENHMGWFCYQVNKKLKHFVEETQRDSSDNVYGEIRNFLTILYRKNKLLAEIESFDNIQLLSFVKILIKKGFSVAVPVFKSPSIEEINKLAVELNIDIEDQVDLFDPLTGEKYERKVTVGVMYILKLHHLVENKIHKRSVGSYSLITQQPPGGRSNEGGQRAGEMEFWALEAHGAAHVIQEMLTVKSDDVIGRLNIYESIVKGENSLKPTMPESFRVLLSELRSLCLNIDLLKYESNDGAKDDEKINTLEEA